MLTKKNSWFLSDLYFVSISICYAFLLVSFYAFFIIFIVESDEKSIRNALPVYKPTSGKLIEFVTLVMSGIMPQPTV